jgi:transposase-like protein
MKRKHYSVELIVAVLKQAELGMPVGDILRQLGISEQTFYRWCAAALRKPTPTKFHTSARLIARVSEAWSVGEKFAASAL